MRQGEAAPAIARVAVFDFDHNGCRSLANAVREWFICSDGGGSVEEYCAIEPLLQSYHRKPHDAVFLVVESMMAVEAARLIRQEDAARPLFLVSSAGEYAMEGFRLRALDYLLHPVSPERVGQALARVGDEALRPFTQVDEWRTGPY